MPDAETGLSVCGVNDPFASGYALWKRCTQFVILSSGRSPVLVLSGGQVAPCWRQVARRHLQAGTQSKVVESCTKYSSIRTSARPRLRIEPKKAVPPAKNGKIKILKNNRSRRGRASSPARKRLLLTDLAKHPHRLATGRRTGAKEPMKLDWGWRCRKSQRTRFPG